MAEENKRWMKLDNAAKIYPAAKSRNWTALFRLSALLTEPVDPMLLARAQQSTLRRFPGFALRLRHGFFWYYLEHNEGAPIIQRDVANPCVRMDLRENDGFMFRVRYYGRRIALEVFHVLADGTGGADDSYGIEVAKLSGIPEEVIKRAKQVLKKTEEEGIVTYKTAPAPDMQLPIEMQQAEELLGELKTLDVNTLTPIEAMQILFDLANKAKSV